MEILHLGWEEVAKIHRTLAKKIEKDGLPDALVVILRGGNVTGTHLSHLLGIRDLYPLLIKRTENDNVCANKVVPEVRFSECLDVQNKNVLIVDDIVGSGESMEIAKKVVLEAKAKTVRSVVLIVNESNFKKDNIHTLVDYIGKTVKTWTIFPWERTK